MAVNLSRYIGSPIPQTGVLLDKAFRSIGLCVNAIERCSADPWCRALMIIFARKSNPGISLSTGLIIGLHAILTVAAYSQSLPPPTLSISGPCNVLVDPIIAAYSSYFAPRTPTNLVNSSGLTAGPSGVLGAADSTHDTNADLTMWYSNPYSTPPDTNPFVTFYLGGSYTLQTTRLWQYNQAGGFTVYGAKDINVLVSADGTNFNLLSTISAARAGGTNGEPAQDFRTTATNVQYITLHIADTFGGATASGLSEVRFVASSAGVTLTLGGVVGQHYQVQCRDSLNSTDSWQLVQDLPYLSNSPALVSVAPPYQSQRFYRALLVP